MSWQPPHQQDLSRVLVRSFALLVSGCGPDSPTGPVVEVTLELTDNPSL
jgi:hypothetical protein